MSEAFGERPRHGTRTAGQGISKYIMGDQRGYMEQLTVGTVVEGTVKQITKFGAFVLLPDRSTGMVHISEIAHSYVNDIHEHLTEGQTVKVMVIGTENGKINLSIKRTVAPPKPQYNRPRPSSDRPQQGGERPAHDRRRPAQSAAPAAPQTKSFDDMLKQFMTESDSKISSLRQYSDRKTKNRRR